MTAYWKALLTGFSTLITQTALPADAPLWMRLVVGVVGPTLAVAVGPSNKQA